jgi:hypothetical protein
MFNSIDIKEECEVVAWVKMRDIIKLHNIPFGVYAITGPEERLPSVNIWPHEHMGVVYFGVAGKSYDDVYYDRKDKDSNRFHKSGKLYQRLRHHRTELGTDPVLFPKQTSYVKFFEEYGFSKDHRDNVNVCVLVPKVKLDNANVRAWLMMIESLSIYLYSKNFGYQPLMQIAHSIENGDTLIDANTLNQKKIKEVSNNSLLEHFS